MHIAQLAESLIKLNERYNIDNESIPPYQY